MKKIKLFTALHDTDNSTGVNVFLSEIEAVGDLLKGRSEEVTECGGQDEFFDAVNNGDISDVYKMECNSIEMDLMDVISANIEAREEKPYLFTVHTVVEESKHTITFLSYSDEPDKVAKWLSDNNSAQCNEYREITPAEAHAWEMAKAIERGDSL